MKKGREPRWNREQAEAVLALLESNAWLPNEGALYDAIVRLRETVEYVLELEGGE